MQKAEGRMKGRGKIVLAMGDMRRRLRRYRPGTFTGCARIQFTYGPFTSTEPQWSGFSCTGTETSWSAPGVGMVRDTTHEVGTKAGSPNQTYDKDIELVSYTVQ